MKALPVVLLVSASVLSGCLGQGSDVGPSGILPGVDLPLLPRPTLACVGTRCNYETTVEPDETRQGNEVTIAVNPTDAGNVVAGAKDYTPETAGQCVWNGVYLTKDGGASWKNDNLPGSPWLLTTDPSRFEPNVLSQYWCATDPVVAFGPDGTFYYSALVYQGDPVTASKIGKDQLGTGVNDFAFNRVSIVVAISSDGGETFDEISVIDSGSFPVNFHDRQWIEVDQENGNVYVAWTAIALPGNLFYRSTDGGRTWSMPVVLNDVPTALHGPGGMYVAVGHGGPIYVSGCGDGGPQVTVSKDAGETFSGFAMAVPATDEGMEAEFRSGMVCMVAADDTDGPHSGNVYLAWSDTRNGDRDIYFARSDDEGSSWSEPVRLNKDDGANDQFFPAVSVSPSGVVDVVWYDRRNDPENRLLDLYHVYSLDGGRTWSDDFRVTDVSSDPVWSKHQGGFTFIGDYIDIDSSEACAHPVWVDTRNEKADVFTACVERPTEPVAPPMAEASGEHEDH
ncbi:MAG: sialidase family protein [Methanobacteriota archaeon]